MLDEWKKFLLRGNILDMAVGVIIGGAFGKIVSSFTSDILMPPLGLMLGKVDFSNFYINLSGTDYETFAAAKEAGAPIIAYGAFLNVCLDFTASHKSGVVTLKFEEGSVTLKDFTATTFHINDDTYKISGSKFKKQ